MWKENRRVYADRSHGLEGDRRASHLGTARRAHPRRGLASARSAGKADTLLTVSFHPEPSGAAAVKLAHGRLDDIAAAMPAIAVNLGPGWEAVLANLDEPLASGG